LNESTCAIWNFRFCTGCWSCWWATPGLCAHKDDMAGLYPKMVEADLVVWASPLILGTVSALLKKAQDRFIPLAHPYIKVVEGECHHRHRYQKNADIGLIVGPTADDDEEDLRIAREFFRRFSLNSRTAFRLSSPRQPPPLRRPPMKRLLLNGSPREVVELPPHPFLEASGLAEGGAGTDIPVLDLARTADIEDQIAPSSTRTRSSSPSRSTTDSSPAVVKNFLERMAAIGPGRLVGKRFGFVVQSGFPSPSIRKTRRPGSAASNAPYGPAPIPEKPDERSLLTWPLSRLALTPLGGYRAWNGVDVPLSRLPLTPLARLQGMEWG
jgi:hypothetical protein